MKDFDVKADNVRLLKELFELLDYVDLDEWRKVRDHLDEEEMSAFNKAADEWVDKRNSAKSSNNYYNTSYKTSLDERVDLGKMYTTAKLVAKGAANVAARHPGLAIAAASIGWNQYKKHKAKQEKTVKFHAKTRAEEKEMKTKVDAMIRSGKYRVVKAHYSGTGRHWELIKDI